VQHEIDTGDARPIKMHPAVSRWHARRRQTGQCWRYSGQTSPSPQTAIMTRLHHLKT
jgi:hypothetical protein